MAKTREVNVELTTQYAPELTSPANFSSEYIDKSADPHYLTTCVCGWSMKTPPNSWGQNISSDPRYINHRIDHIEAILDIAILKDPNPIMTKTKIGGKYPRETAALSDEEQERRNFPISYGRLIDFNEAKKLIYQAMIAGKLEVKKHLMGDEANNFDFDANYEFKVEDNDNLEKLVLWSYNGFPANSDNWTLIERAKPYNYRDTKA